MTPNSKPARPRTPSFASQGVLIVLPAVLLAGFGLWSLRQDRLLARADAADQAGQLAAELVERLAHSLSLAGPTPAAVDRFLAAPGQGDGDPVLGYAQLAEPRVAFQTDGALELLYPPPIRALPAPVDHDLETLTPAQQADWATAQHALFLEADRAAAVAALERFLTESVPAPFAAQAAYTLGTLLAQLGESNRAGPWLETVVRQYPDALAESGVPLRTWAELQLLRLTFDDSGRAAQRAAWISDLCAEAVLRPSPFSAFLLEEADALELAQNRGVEGGPIVGGWRRVWEAHEFARRLFAVWQAAARIQDPNSESAPTNAWLELPSGQAWLITPAAGAFVPALGPESSSRWWFALTDDQARTLAARTAAERRCPKYLGIQVAAGDEILLPLDSDAELLATRRKTPETPGVPIIAASVFLVDTVALYARQRTRTVVFGTLIGISLVAVLVGCSSARQAFRREHRLNEMKTNFVSSVSHELRAPIASVRLMAEELHSAATVETPQSRQYLRFILLESRRLSALIDNVLDFARHEQGRKRYEFEFTDMVRLTRETVELMRAGTADRQIKLEQVLPEHDVTWEVDGHAIQQVLVNLIDNAVKHSPDGATITVGLETQNAGPATASPQLRLWVEDTGEGIPPEDHQRIFERFYRRGSELRRQTPGVGLGLAIVKYTVEAHHGRVHVRSAPGQGSRFTVELPKMKNENGGRHTTE